MTIRRNYANATRIEALHKKKKGPTSGHGPFGGACWARVRNHVTHREQVSSRQKQQVRPAAKFLITKKEKKIKPPPRQFRFGERKKHDLSPGIEKRRLKEN